jgi:hypothetical protein
MNEDKPKLALRVFKRTPRCLILLWRRVDGVDPLKAEITFRELSDKAKDGDVKVPPQFLRIDEPVEGGDREASISEETVVCLVNEKDAGLDPSAVYYVKVRYGKDEEGIRVTPAGVFPSHEREDRQKNVHLLGWDDEGQIWRKVSVVKGPKGRFYLATVCPECQERGE